ncbi:hypothetical protein KKE54_07345 [bacterium]|nr:hypothetical protein [bacterium]
MSKEQLVELQRQHNAGQLKYTYFLLAAAGAAIAFSVQKTMGYKLSYSMIPLGLANISWSLSFYLGCKSVNAIQSAMQSNYRLLELAYGYHQSQPDTDAELDIALDKTREACERKIETAHKFDIWQFRTLIIGAVLFIAWHITEMALVGSKP